MPTPRRHDAATLLLAAPLLLQLMMMAPSAAAQTDASRDKDNGGGAGGGFGPAGGTTKTPGFSAPMAVLLVALIAAFSFIGFFSVYMRRCGRAGSLGGPAIPAAALLALSRRQERDRQRGLDPAVVASFPTMRYAEARELRVGGKDAALECAVCLSEFEDDEELLLLPSCSHAFHPDCIGEWLAGHVTCPVCRCNLDPAEIAAAETTSTSSSGEVVTGEQQQQDQVIIDVNRDGTVEDEGRRRKEAMELDRIGSQRRAVRSRSGRPLPRSHSTGHSLTQRLDGDLERFTLRLPEHVRRGMVAESLRRTGPARGDRGAGARSARLGRSDRWPSFIARTFSGRVPFWGAASRRAPDAAEAVAAATEGSAATSRSKREKPAVAAADGGTVTNSRSVRFDCLGGGGGGEAEEDEEKAIVVGQA